MRLPPEDRKLSPYTGWTRSHWEAAADAMLAAVAPHATPGQALINLPGPRPSWSGPRSDGLEGYARTFQLAALRVAGAGGEDPAGLLDRYAAGLDAGTRHPTRAPELTGGDGESWPVITDRGQPMVEAATVALALRLTRPWLWDRLDDGVRERAGRWLAEALHRTPHENNWWLFPLAVGGFLAEAGIETVAAEAAVARGLEKIDGWYLGGGWYTDGRPRAFDHYNGWAMHLTPVLHAHLARDTALTARYGERLAAYLDAYTGMFGGDGAPVHQGRSLSYRFAAAAPLWAGALTGRTPLAPGATRRIASGALRYFLDRGALDAEGRLTLGWHGAHPPLVQPYSGPASPYWSASGFLGLLLPPDHPVWTATEEPGPAELADTARGLPEPGWLLQSTAADGIVRLHNHGSDDQPAAEVAPDNPLYAALAHSTVTGPTEGLPDNHFGLRDGDEVSERGRIEPLGAGPGWAASAHTPRLGGRPLPGVRVTSLSLADGAEEVRLHLVSGAAPDTPVVCGGWAPAGEELRTGAEDGTAWVRTADGTHSELRGLLGLAGAEVRTTASGTAFGPRAAVPVLHGATGAGGSLFLAALRLTGADARDTGERPRVRVTPRPAGWSVRVDWPGGGSHRAEVAAGSVRVAHSPAPRAEPGG
ncbi:DUF2264 domain-containing protein [Streptomyces physcomitrii]|uniref:DUF2264 domain-containing protein n=1 Tax=Streptomyces physcomitrii TaxID=2724184 RepID=A0ABX1H9Q4_9ACTN|nr:DUF2264 domain-containing protein [Streptomyces physcomitrii]NKI45111.1 DUF2264 domain-containing protein [Streptomyces physcomitrii]